MHTWYYRLNALLTVATTALAALCGLASLTDVLHSSEPVVLAHVHRVDGLSVGILTRHILLGVLPPAK